MGKDDGPTLSPNNGSPTDGLPTNGPPTDRRVTGKDGFSRLQIAGLMITAYISLMAPAVTIFLWLLNFSGDTKERLAQNHAMLEVHTTRLGNIEATLRTLDSRVDRIDANIAVLLTDLDHIKTGILTNK